MVMMTQWADIARAWYPNEVMQILRETWARIRPPRAFNGAVVYLFNKEQPDPHSGDTVLVLAESDTLFERYVRSVASLVKPENVMASRAQWILNGVRYRYLPITGDLSSARGVRPYKIVLVNTFLTMQQWHYVSRMFMDEPNIESYFD